MEVYRVEDRHGRGPFVMGDINPGRSKTRWHDDEDYIAAFRTVNELPAPYRDGGLARATPGSPSGYGLILDQGLKVGAKDMDQLSEWFPNVILNRLAKSPKGFGVSVYEVPDDKVLHGDHQLVWPKAEQKLVQREPLADLLADAQMEKAK